MYAVGRRLWGALEGTGRRAWSGSRSCRSRTRDTPHRRGLSAVAVAAYGSSRSARTARARYFLIAGLGLGLTVAFKYTAGLILVPVLVAIVLRALKEERTLRRLAIGTALVGRARVLVFFLTNPYFVLDLGEAIDELRAQRYAGERGEARPGGGEPVRASTCRACTWGLGWAALAAALVGVVWQWRRDRTRAILLPLFPVLLFLYLGSDAERYFARWLLPAYPILALWRASRSRR